MGSFGSGTGFPRFLEESRRMKNFIYGVVVAVLVPLIGTFLFLKMGLMPVNADAVPGRFEHMMANMSLDASVARNQPDQQNPVAVSDASLISAIRLYKQNCEECHGGNDGKPSTFGLSFYPPVPQFSLRQKPFHDPDAHIFYVIKHGIRLTGMPSFGSKVRPMLTDNEIWTLVTFLKNFPPTSWSPAVQRVWKSNAHVSDSSKSTAPPSPGASAPSATSPAGTTASPAATH